MSILIKSIFAKIFENAGFVKILVSYKSKNKYLILMYHRIIPYQEAEKGMQAGMYVEPDTFKMHLHYLKKHFNIITFSEIFNYIGKDRLSKKREYPICIITFDDGWYDFYKYAYPILKTEGVPATVFLPTKYIGTDKRFWTDQLTTLFVLKEKSITKKNNQFINNSLVKQMEGLEGPMEWKIETAISILKKYGDDVVYNTLTELKNLWNIDIDINKRVFLNWEEIREMAESGFIYFGSHSDNHKILTYLNQEETYEELVNSKQILISEGIVRNNFISFSYPNGIYNESVVEMVKKAGYNAAVTTDNGWNLHDTSFYRLKRIPIHQDMSSTKDMFGCRITNII